MSEFIADVEQQYEVYCKIAEEYGFIDFNAKKNGFRCTTKSNEFNAGWVAFTSAVAAVRDEQQAKIDDLEKQLDMMKYINDEQSKNIQNAFKTIEIEQGFKDELQKRIDAVLQVLCELKESMDGFKEMDLYDKGYRVTTEYVIADLEQALRGEHANPD